MVKITVIVFALIVGSVIAYPSSENATSIVYPEDHVSMESSTGVSKPVEISTEKPVSELVPTSEMNNSSSITNKHDVVVASDPATGNSTTTSSPEVSTIKLKGAAFSVRATSFVVIIAFVGHLLL